MEEEDEKMKQDTCSVELTQSAHQSFGNLSDLVWNNFCNCLKTSDQTHSDQGGGELSPW